jgi:glycerol-3-phosphate acyltransferase PlsY
VIVGYLLAAIGGYLLGSIPFGLLITGGAGLGDIRKIGSGNIGATNVLRTGRRGLAAATLLLDAAKGAAAVLIAKYFWGADAALIAGVLAFIGHCFPVWLGFKGGKGVAVFIGVLLGLAWPVGVIFCAVWLVIAFAQKFSSLASLTAAVTAPIFAYVVALYDPSLDGPKLSAVIGVIVLLLIFSHRTNIGRLIAGTEPKIGSEKPKAG